MVFLKPLMRYADFKGRAGRAEYWGFFLFQSVIGGLLATVTLLSITPGESGGGALIGGLLIVAAALAFIVPHWAVTVRRLHDTDRSAWWLLLQAPSVLAPLSFFGAIMGVVSEPSLGAAAAQAFLALAGSGLLLLMLGGICSSILMVMMWLPGTDGENRFGADPRSPEAGLYLDSSRSGGLSDDRLEALFAEARQENEQQRSPEPGWSHAAAAPGFGRRGLSG